MATRGSRTVRGSIVVMAVALASAVAAQGLPRLPGESVLPGGEGSPGKVTFSHRTHVDQHTPRCTRCHPVLFKILGGETRVADASYHAAMDRGRRCGACHDGKTAWPVTFETCQRCHRSP